MLRIVILVFVGGGIGALARELLMLGVRVGYDGFPLDILAANIVGSFILGTAAALHARARIGDVANAFVGTGFCGGFTTFSAFSLDAALLWERGEAGLAALYVGASVVLSLAGVAAGLGLSRLMLAGGAA